MVNHILPTLTVKDKSVKVEQRKFVTKTGCQKHF